MAGKEAGKGGGANGQNRLKCAAYRLRESHGQTRKMRIIKRAIEKGINLGRNLSTNQICLN